MNLFAAAMGQGGQRPLADVLRPSQLSEVIGQEALLAEGGALQRLLAQGQLPSLILWGPPGVGKTTLARLLGQTVQATFVALSATSSGVKELRQEAEAARERLNYYQQRTVLFIDEIHRFSKAQQDALLPHVEQGELILIGATTENPCFQVNHALLSRCLLLQLHPLGQEALLRLVKRAFHHYQTQFPHLRCQIQKDAAAFLLHYANGDARALLTLLEAAFWATPRQPLTPTQETAPTEQVSLQVETLKQLAPQALMGYDADGDNHYDTASAYQKSLRGSDVDAALYWLAKMIAGGEDVRFIARRLMVCAAEDVGMADPQAFVIASQAFAAAERLGLPEGRIPLAMATVYVAKAPKSNHAYVALDAALAAIQQEGKNYPVPPHLRDAHYGGASQLGHGVGYRYTHEHPHTPQHFLPDALIGTQFWQEPSTPL